jgi:hypothetical protein
VEVVVEHNILDPILELQVAAEVAQVGTMLVEALVIQHRDLREVMVFAVIEVLEVEAVLES